MAPDHDSPTGQEPEPELPSSDTPDVAVVHRRTERLPVPLVGPPTSETPSIPAPASNATSDHARQDSGHTATQRFFLDHRERQGTLSLSRQGLFSVDELMPVQYQTLFHAPPAHERPAPKAAPPPTQSAQTMMLAKAAFMRTVNFLDDLVRRTPNNERGDLIHIISQMPGAPRNLPKDDAVMRFQLYARLMGYYGPVLHFMPPRISLTHLKNAGWISPMWWWDEPNFPKGHQSLSPYEPEDHGEGSEPGTWVLALPGIMPGTANLTYNEQAELKPEVARMVGLRVVDGHIHHRENLHVYIAGVADVCVFSAINLHARNLLSNEPTVTRTSTVIHTYQPDVEKTSRRLGDKSSSFTPSLQSRCHVSVATFPGAPMQLCDYGDTARGLALGLTPFFYPSA